MSLHIFAHHALSRNQTDQRRQSGRRRESRRCVLGFTLPLAHAVAQAANLVDMLIRGLIALIVQLVCYLFVRALIPGLAKDIHDGKVAPGVFLGVVSLAAGILNAACMAD